MTDREDAERSAPEAAPDDLSLDRLSEAFAQAMGRARHGPAGPAPEGESAQAPGPAANSETAGADPESGPGPAAGPDGPVTPRAIVEAILFVGHPENEPIPGERIARLLRGVEPREVDQLVRDLNDEYEAAGYPYEIASAGAGYRMQLRSEFADTRNRFYGRLRQARLSQAAVDVLAIVAYYQPVTQQQVDRMRQARSGRILAQLLRRGLLRVELEPDSPPARRYRTTDRFLELFGLDSLDSLPRSEDPQ
jgi:segregation and condensation protein B